MALFVINIAPFLGLIITLFLWVFLRKKREKKREKNGVEKVAFRFTKVNFSFWRIYILPLRKEPEYKAVLPGKLFEYLASWRPVLGIGQPDGAMSMILNTTKTGVVLDWEDKASIARYIDFCWERHLAGKLTVEDADISQFTRRNLTRRMAELFNSITNP